jgi:enoyl-CoA hydratase/carnithine racemase
MSVRVEKQGPITTVVLSRPQARNAVDPATAKALADAFRAFDADPEASVAVLFGEGGTFCAGAEQMDLAFPDAMQNELRHGLRALAAGAREGAKRFVGGAGRGGTHQ